jgi:hypothetical protein
VELYFPAGTGGLRLQMALRQSASRQSSVIIRVNPWLAFCCLQNRLNELGQNYAIEIREW